MGVRFDRGYGEGEWFHLPESKVSGSSIFYSFIYLFNKYLLSINLYQACFMPGDTVNNHDRQIPALVEGDRE